MGKNYWLEYSQATEFLLIEQKNLIDELIIRLGRSRVKTPSFKCEQEFVLDMIKERGCTVYGLAKNAGIDPKNLSRACKRGDNKSIYFDMIASELGVTVEYLQTGIRKETMNIDGASRKIMVCDKKSTGYQLTWIPSVKQCFQKLPINYQEEIVAWVRKIAETL